MNLEQVTIYDTTLRDGNQAKGLNLSLQDKLTIAGMLDDFGVDYIEGGWPNPTNPLDTEFYVQASKIKWKHSKISVFGSTCRAGVPAKEDKGLGYLVQSKAPVACIFGKSWDLHVTEIIRTTLDENLRMIEDSIAFLKKNHEEVIYDAEHFFDGYKANPEYALKTLKAADAGGADCVVLCDTNGGMALSWEIEKIVKIVKESINCTVGIHTHNDTGTAVANALAAVKAGARQVQGTINGYGERCGNANLTVLIPNIQLKMGKSITVDNKIGQLRTLSVGVSEIANLTDDIRQPYVGEAAFAHKGGAHIDGVMKVSHSFEHMDPTLVGNKRDFIVSNQSGGALVLAKIKAIKPEASKGDAEVKSILATIKAKEEEGFHFEVAEGSFQILARRAFGMVEEKFKVLSYRVIEENRNGGPLYSEATVKVAVGDAVEHTASEGNGPVDAMAKAMRKALTKFFPELSKVVLEDYKVRVLDNGTGTGSKVRVWIRFHNNENKKVTSWSTIGVSTNIIEASWEALIDGINYKLMGLDQ